jgi:hypothetical protein
VNRAAVIEQLKRTQETLGRLLTLLESGETDRFVAHLYQARKQYRLVRERLLPVWGNPNFPNGPDYGLLLGLEAAVADWPRVKAVLVDELKRAEGALATFEAGIK